MRTTLLLLLSFTFFRAWPQQPPGNPTPYRQFMAEAQALPRLYEAKDFDSINYYVQLRWVSGRLPVDLFAQSVLLSIQRGIFDGTGLEDLSDLDPQVIGYLQHYGRALDSCIAARRSGAYDRHLTDTAILQQVFLTLSRWSNDLLANPKLDTAERFFCRVFDGEIPPAKISRFLQDSISAVTPEPQPAWRPGLFGGGSRARPDRKFAGVVLAGGGLWVPTGQLSFVGVHPTIGYAFGIRSLHTEWDFDIDGRWGNSRQPYMITRKDSLMTISYYDGFNFSIDYTRFLLRARRVEFGPTGGIGIDLTDFVSDPSTVDWTPTSISSLGLNLGFRANWNFSRHFFLALDTRFHRLNYHNPGGTSFAGDAFTVGLRLGYVASYKQ